MSQEILHPNPEAIRRLEHISLRALPALETVLYDGWTLRYSNGYTGRANSVNPFDGSTLPLAEKIAYCEAWFTERGLATRFRLNEAVYPSHLDGVLEERAYHRYNETQVQTADLADFPSKLDKRFHYKRTVDDSWITAFGAMNHAPSDKLTTAKTMLERIATPCAYAWIGDDALGLAVYEGDYVGLFDIVVRPEKRGQGLGRAIVSSLLAWGKAQGAKTAYLQVVATNQVALNLYASLGFRLHHRYWYRQKPLEIMV